MEIVCHGTVEGGSSVLKTKGNYSICKCAPRGCECILIKVFFPDLDLVIDRKSIHEGKGLMSGACIDDLIDEGCWEVVFGKPPILCKFGWYLDFYSQEQDLKPRWCKQWGK